MHKHYQKIRFILGGLSTTALLYIALIIQVEVFGIHYLIAVNVAMVFARFYSYCINKYLVFRNNENSHLKQGSRFIALQVGMTIATNTMLIIYVELLGLHYILATLINGVIFAIINYLILSRVVFKNEPVIDKSNYPTADSAKQ